MALGIDPARDGQPNHFQLCRPELTAFRIGFAEHHAADFTGANTAAKIKRTGQCLTWILTAGDMRQKFLCIDIDGMSSRRLKNRGSECSYFFAQIRYGANAISKIVFFQDFFQSPGKSFQIVAGGSAVGGKSLGDDQYIACPAGQIIIIDRQKTAHVDQSVFFSAHGAAVCIRKHLPGNFSDGFISVAGFAYFDKVGIFGKAAGI